MQFSHAINSMTIEDQEFSQDAQVEVFSMLGSKNKKVMEAEQSSIALLNRKPKKNDMFEGQIWDLGETAAENINQFIDVFLNKHVDMLMEDYK